MKKYIRGARDSLGVPIEPDEEIPVAFDYLGDPIYEQEQYFIINDDIVLDDVQKVYDYIKENYDSIDADLIEGDKKYEDFSIF